MGRPRKKNKHRTAKGRISRARRHTYDHGTEAAQWRKMLFGADGHDAIGRAFACGLLSKNEDDAKLLRDVARNFAYVYWRWMPSGLPRQAATEASGLTKGGKVVSYSTERDIRAERALKRDLAAITSLGVRTPFDQLVVDLNPDSGPSWLDRLIITPKNQRDTMRKELELLDQALEGLWVIAG